MTNGEKEVVIAVLEELLKEVDGLCIDSILSEDEEDINRGIEMAADVIQEKINELGK